mmetsp:Transcript_923/g.1040  ORF Transcript_923/g.1040 Transcript_923/m.1040 type:complete len:631 (+) Transcript_923:2118-4010(+)
MRLISFLYCIIFALGIVAKTHTFHFNASYIIANPDGVHERRVIGINNEWPLPTIRIKKNDRVEIYLTNSLEDRNTSLHFHGLFQQESNSMDGPEMVTQCPIAPGLTFLYNFTVSEQAGTYWYHSHSGAQYSDGLRGVFIVEDDEKLPFKYDEEVTLTVSDWYHMEYPDVMSSFLSRYNPTGAEPIPQNSLFNDTKNATWHVEPDTSYLVRIVNMGMFTSQYLYIEDHSFTIVEIDGNLVEPVETDSLYIAVAQRISVLVRTKNSTTKNYRFVNIIDEEMLDFLPDELLVISTNWVAYNDKELPQPLRNGPNEFAKLTERLKPVDDFDLKPLSKEALFPDYDYQIHLDFTMDNLGDGVNYALFNDITYVPPKVPTLLTVLSSGKYAGDAEIYGSNTNTHILQHNEIVEIVLNNRDAGKHPFHLHGHNFQVISRSEAGEDEENPILYDPKNPDHTNFPDFPMIRDTVMVNPNGFIVLRFKADNPGVWFFHCHVDWHLEQGLAITLVEAPFEIQKSQNISSNHWDACALANVSSKGNAAGKYGDSKDIWHDLSGENLQPEPLPAGFTMKGYIAFLICSFCAIFGLYSIYKYGMEDIKNDSNEAVVHKLYQILETHGALDESEQSALFSVNSRE